VADEVDLEAQRLLPVPDVLPLTYGFDLG
jgi:hypothetical protein